MVEIPNKVRLSCFSLLVHVLAALLLSNFICRLSSKLGIKRFQWQCRMDHTAPPQNGRKVLSLLYPTCSFLNCSTVLIVLSQLVRGSWRWMLLVDSSKSCRSLTFVSFALVYFSDWPQFIGTQFPFPFRVWNVWGSLCRQDIIHRSKKMRYDWKREEHSSSYNILYCIL